MSFETHDIQEEDVHEDVVGDEDEEEEATESSEDSNTGTEEGEGDSMEEDSELDESVLEDQVLPLDLPAVCSIPLKKYKDKGCLHVEQF